MGLFRVWIMSGLKDIRALGLSCDFAATADPVLCLSKQSARDRKPKPGRGTALLRPIQPHWFNQPRVDETLQSLDFSVPHTRA